MTMVPKTVPLADAWEAGELKCSDELTQTNEEEIDQELIDGLKLIAKRKGIAYRPLVRQVLWRLSSAS